MPHLISRLISSAQLLDHLLLPYRFLIFLFVTSSSFPSSALSVFLENFPSHSSTTIPFSFLSSSSFFLSFFSFTSFPFSFSFSCSTTSFISFPLSFSFPFSFPLSPPSCQPVREKNRYLSRSGDRPLSASSATFGKTEPLPSVGENATVNW